MVIKMMSEYRFQVNLGGMIEILSDHLYSSPDVYIRELLQNGVDAITARMLWEQETAGVPAAGKGSGADRNLAAEENGAARNLVPGEDSGTDQSPLADQGTILLEIEEGSRLVFSDNGQGLTEEEIHQFLAVIGESSKRSPKDGRIRTDYIGRFGIGLLSCFMVADEIRMRTRSCKGDFPVLEWRGKPDGTYTIAELPQDSLGDLPFGTQVILEAKPGREAYFTEKVIRRLLTYYGILLPFPVIVRIHGKEEQINPIYLPWEGRKTNRQELLLFGQMMFEEQFLDCVPLRSEQGNVSGVAYIVKYPVLPSAKGSHRIYLKNMLLTEKGDNLIPDWAVFTRCIINATDLRPTASREGFYVDGVLDQAREDIENALIDYIAEMAEENRELFDTFFRIHRLTLMSLALASPKLFEMLVDHCEFETTRGTQTGYDLRSCGKPLVYAPTAAKYKQLSQIFFAQDKMLINVSYVHSLDLLIRLGQLYDLEVRAVDDWNVEDLMEDLIPDDQDESFAFQKAANRILKAYDCRAELKYFSPYNQPTFYLMDEKVLLKRQIAASRSQADSMFFQMLDAFAAEIPSDTAAVLYFNYNNPLVKKLAAVEAEPDLKLLVEILYVQALQIGGFVLHNNELGMLNRNILALMERGLSDE
ncbi:MAG: HSP90 family protein [Lachnospiraceae bacterium]|nr:HSP90 family protein [Lachnospiraceae bacterium]MCM1238658.1 HSP90 family protein [Lachnospiraceae bacterium]